MYFNFNFKTNKPNITMSKELYDYLVACVNEFDNETKRMMKLSKNIELYSECLKSSRKHLSELEKIYNEIGEK